VRREPLLAALLCLVGAFLVLVGVGQEWAHVEVAAGPLAPESTVDVAGRDLAAGVQALGLVGLAGVVAIAATRSWGRVVVGVLLALAGLGIVVAAAGVDVVVEAGRVAQGEVGPTPWRAVTVGGGVLLVGAGVLVAVRGRRWSSLGRRYEPPAAEPVAPAPAAPERELWEALDRGEDPTAAAPGSDDEDGRLA
jgi:uncharacterized membrane protein (TIGR02234 family)